MRKISRAEEQYNSLNFRTADADEGEKCMSPNGVSYESAAANGGRTTCGRPAVGYGFNKQPTCGGKTCARIEYTHYLGSVKPWGQEEHFRVVDNDTPLTEGGPRCEGCGGALQDYRGGSICRNRACDKRDMLFNVKAEPQTHTVHPNDSRGFSLFPEHCTNSVHKEGFDNSDQYCPECGDNWTKE